jgi:hypothetical protein
MLSWLVVILLRRPGCHKLRGLNRWVGGERVSVNRMEFASVTRAVQQESCCLGAVEGCECDEAVCFVIALRATPPREISSAWSNSVQ